MCRNAREMYYNLYVKGMAFADLQKLSPFVAFEVERQGLKRAE